MRPACCRHATAGRLVVSTGRNRRWAAWLVPSVLLALCPKCPACLATYVALIAGLGMSAGTAATLRTGLIVGCEAALVYLAVRQICHWRTTASRRSGIRENSAEVR